ncbi:FAD-binding domain-containing protein [Thozetella sp. PMI_491]|nr:FAD-binding domain-containing protein [Thozetella sp. PMI_491]
MVSIFSDDRVKEVLAVLEPLLKQIGTADVLTPAHPNYALHTEAFSTDLELHPAVAFAPSSAETLGKILAFLYKSHLKFVVRGRGAQSPSATDVIISTLNFDGFEYDAVKKVATIGVGNTWIDVAGRMRDLDPNFSIAVARTPSVGVGGSILHGGLSWLTGEFGLISDPNNLLNAEVVKYDGSVVMASTDPDLMWALRGSGGGFGVMTKVVLQAHPYPTDIWSGMILVPKEHVEETARKAATFFAKPQHPKVCILMYSAKKHLLSTVLEEKDLKLVTGDMMALHVYDACGEAHGRETFDWALTLPNAIDCTVVTDIKGVVDMQQNYDRLRGVLRKFFAIPIAVSTIDAKTIMRAMEWQDTIAGTDPEIQNRTLLAIQCFVLRPPIGELSEVAWPRPADAKHYILVITGAPANGSDEQAEKARQIAIEAPSRVLGESQVGMILPTGHEAWHDSKHTYGEHWEKLAELRKRYDPDLKFQALIKP